MRGIGDRPRAALRWASEDALKVYKVPNKATYAGWLTSAERVKLTGVRLAAMQVCIEIRCCPRLP